MILNTNYALTSTAQHPSYHFYWNLKAWESLVYMLGHHSKGATISFINVALSSHSSHSLLSDI